MQGFYVFTHQDASHPAMLVMYDAHHVLIASTALSDLGYVPAIDFLHIDWEDFLSGTTPDAQLLKAGKIDPRHPKRDALLSFIETSRQRVAARIALASRLPR